MEASGPIREGALLALFEGAEHPVAGSDARYAALFALEGDVKPVRLWLYAPSAELDELPLGSHEGPAGLFLVGPAGAAGCGRVSLRPRRPRSSGSFSSVFRFCRFGKYTNKSYLCIALRGGLSPRPGRNASRSAVSAASGARGAEEEGPECACMAKVPNVRKTEIMKKIIASPGAPKAVGPYSQAVEAGGTLYVSGQLPIDASTAGWPRASRPRRVSRW